MGAADVLARVVRREISCVWLVEETLNRIAARNPSLNAFLAVDAEAARARAAALDAHLAAGRPPLPLHGLPVAVKDNICTRGLATTCGSRILETYVPPYDAHVVERLRDAGAVIVGKTNLDEFAMGSSTENSAFGPTRNPWDPARVPGGSSGGSAAAVGAGLVDLALGSDTGGSIRQPAAFCGVVGLKPTYGLVSRYGLVAFASSLDQVGPMASDVRGAAMLLDAIAAPDARDATCDAHERPSYAAALADPGPPLRIGVIAPAYAETHPAFAAIDAVVAALARRGHAVRPVALPRLPYGVPAYYLVATSEASANLARFDGVRYGRRAARPADVADLISRSRQEGFGPEVKRRILLGTFALSRGYHDAYYLTAQKVRGLIREDYHAAFRDVDVILTPTTPEPPFALGERTADPVSMYLSDYYTVGANLAGLPALSVPCGLAEPERLPIGLQIAAPPFEEVRLLRAALAVEEIVAGTRPAARP